MLLKPLDEEEHEDRKPALSSSGLLTDAEASFSSREFNVVGAQHPVYMSKVILRMVSTSLSENVKAIILEKALSKPSVTCCLIRVSELGIEAHRTSQLQ